MVELFLQVLWFSAYLKPFLAHWLVEVEQRFLPSYNIASYIRWHFWRNSTLNGAAAFFKTKIGDFRKWPFWTLSTLVEVAHGGAFILLPVLWSRQILWFWKRLAKWENCSTKKIATMRLHYRSRICQLNFPKRISYQGAYILQFLILTFPIYLCIKNLTKNMECLCGYPHYPLERMSLPKSTPNDYLWPPFLIAESFPFIFLYVGHQYFHEW